MKIPRHIKKCRLRTKVIKKIEEISADQWNNVFPKVPESYYFLKTLDESNFEQFSFYYILVYERKQSFPDRPHAKLSSKLVGTAPCFTVNYSLDTSMDGPLRRLTNAVKKIAPNIFSIKALVCGIPMGQGQIGNIPCSFDVTEAIVRRMEMLARKIHAPIIAFKDFDQSYDKILGPLTKKGFLKIESLPTTKMSLTFKDFDEYFKKLSANTRSSLRRKFKKAEPADIECSVADAPDENTLNEAYRLYLQVVNTHDIGFEVLPVDFFKIIARNMPNQAKFFLSKVNGKLAAFMFCLVSQELFLNYFLGFDYEIAREYHLYFINFRDTLNWCIEHGIRNYEMGTTGYDAKRRLGFDFVPLHLYVKMRPRPLRPVLKILSTLLKFENFDPELKRWKRSRK